MVIGLFCLILFFQSGVVSVCLCDMNGKEELHINDQLVTDGFAEFASDEEEKALGNLESQVTANAASKLAWK